VFDHPDNFQPWTPTVPHKHQQKCFHVYYSLVTHIHYHVSYVPVTHFSHKVLISSIMVLPLAGVSKNATIAKGKGVLYYVWLTINTTISVGSFLRS
jgi:hypothetical protein